MPSATCWHGRAKKFFVLSRVSKKTWLINSIERQRSDMLLQKTVANPGHRTKMERYCLQMPKTEKLWINKIFAKVILLFRSRLSPFSYVACSYFSCQRKKFCKEYKKVFLVLVEKLFFFSGQSVSSRSIVTQIESLSLKRTFSCSSRQLSGFQKLADPKQDPKYQVRKQWVILLSAGRDCAKRADGKIEFEKKRKLMALRKSRGCWLGIISSDVGRRRRPLKNPRDLFSRFSQMASGRMVYCEQKTLETQNRLRLG